MSRDTLREKYKKEVLSMLSDIRSTCDHMIKRVKQDVVPTGGALQNTHNLFSLFGKLDLLEELDAYKEEK